MKRALSGEGTARLPARPALVWAALLDPEVLCFLTPGAETVERLEPNGFRASVSFGIGGLRGRYRVTLRLADLLPPASLGRAGACQGTLGGGDAAAHVALAEEGEGTRVAWRFTGTVRGPVSLVGGTLLRVTSRLFVDRFFARLARHLQGNG